MALILEAPLLVPEPSAQIISPQGRGLGVGRICVVSWIRDTRSILLDCDLVLQAPCPSLKILISDLICNARLH